MSVIDELKAWLIKDIKRLKREAPGSEWQASHEQVLKKLEELEGEK